MGKKRKKNNMTIASTKLRNIGGKGSGVVGSGKIEETLKRLGLTVADLKKLG